MKAVRLARLGKPLEEAELVVPEIARDEVLVRVAACGICHSDAHYRAGVSPVSSLPITLGHEIAGSIEAVGDHVDHVSPGDRVCVHYLITCGRCQFCSRGHEQFCVEGQMVGKHRDGGYAEFIKVPGRNVFILPEEISWEHGAIMMCSSATALHALTKARSQPGDSVAIFGFGGLGFSAFQLAKAFGCGDVYVVDINPAKLATASSLGGLPINAAARDAAQQISQATGGKGVDVSIDLVGSAATMRQAVQCLGVLGRAAVVALTKESLSIRPYPELIGKEVEVIGVSDHLSAELALLMDLAKSGKLTFPEGTVRTVDLDADQINTALDQFSKSSDQIRTVIRMNV